MTGLNCRLVSEGHGVLIHRVVRLVDRTGRIRTGVGTMCSGTCSSLGLTGVALNIYNGFTEAVPISGKLSLSFHDMVNIRVPGVSLGDDGLVPCFNFGSAGSRLSRTCVGFGRTGGVAMGLTRARTSVCQLTSTIGGARGHTGTLGGVVVPRFANAVGCVSRTLRRGRHRSFAELGTIGGRGRRGGHRTGWGSRSYGDSSFAILFVYFFTSCTFTIIFSCPC